MAFARRVKSKCRLGIIEQGKILEQLSGLAVDGSRCERRRLVVHVCLVENEMLDLRSKARIGCCQKSSFIGDREKHEIRVNLISRHKVTTASNACVDGLNGLMNQRDVLPYDDVNVVRRFVVNLLHGLVPLFVPELAGLNLLSEIRSNSRAEVKMETTTPRW